MGVGVKGRTSGLDPPRYNWVGGGVYTEFQRRRENGNKKQGGERKRD